MLLKIIDIFYLTPSPAEYYFEVLVITKFI